MSKLMEMLERAVADPTNQSQEVLFIRKMRSIAAEGSAGDGGVVATVNGYGALVAMWIAPEMLADVPRLEGSVKRAVNRAKEEARRQAPPPPLPPLGPGYINDVSDLPLAPSESALEQDASKTRPEFLHAWWDSLDRLDEAHRDALRDAVHPIHERISHDAQQHPRELWPLFSQVLFRLGDPRLTAYSVRRGAGIEDSSILERFRREVGLSLTRYIRERQRETAVRLVYTSDLPLEDIASMLGYTSEHAISNIVRWWSMGMGRWSPADLRHAWREWGLDMVLLKWAKRGEATREQAAQVWDQLERLRLRIEQAYEGEGEASA